MSTNLRGLWSFSVIIEAEINGTFYQTKAKARQTTIAATTDEVAVMSTEPELSW